VTMRRLLRDFDLLFTGVRTQTALQSCQKANQPENWISIGQLAFTLSALFIGLPWLAVPQVYLAIRASLQ
jgi:hypothetical protein